MFFYHGKSVFCAFLLGIFLIFAPDIAAQKIIRQQKAVIETQSKQLRSESETDSAKISGEKLPDSDDSHESETDFEDKISDQIEQTEKIVKEEIKNFTNHFLSENNHQRQVELESLLKKDRDALFSSRQVKKNDFVDADNLPAEEGFQWREAVQQSLIFLAVQHGYAFTQPKTREALKGKFFKDYAKSVKSLRGWDDGGRFFTNYIAHPMQGSMTGFIYVQNDPKAITQQFSMSGDYWRSRMKAFLWTTAWSTQFEIGPISQASIGNVGLKGKQTWEDIIVTPVLGTAMLVGEDALDRHLMQFIERKTDNFYVKIFSRMLLSPTRNFSNMLRFKAPWHRDRPTAH